MTTRPCRVAGIPPAPDAAIESAATDTIETNVPRLSLVLGLALALAGATCLAVPGRAAPPRSTANGDAPPRPADPSGSPMHYREQARIEGHFVADLGEAFLVRHARTSEDVTFRRYDARTGEARDELGWMATILPPLERVHVERFRFAAPWVSVVEDEPPRRTCVRALDDGRVAWCVPSPSSLELVEGRDGPVAIVIDPEAAVVAVADVARGQRLWQARAQGAHVVFVGATPTSVLTFEASNAGPETVGRLVARRLEDGRECFAASYANPPWAPILVRANARWTAIAQGSELALHATDTGRPAATRPFEQRIDSLALVEDSVAVVERERLHLLRAHDLAPRHVHAETSGCVYGTSHGFVTVVEGFEWRLLDAVTGTSTFALGGGHCDREFVPVARARPTLVLRAPGAIVVYERTETPVPIGTLRVRGRVTLDGPAVEGLRVSLGARSTITDRHGRYAIALRTLGHFRLRVDAEALEAKAPGRCVGAFPGPSEVDHRGPAGERTLDLSFHSYEPNPLTRCSPM